MAHPRLPPHIAEAVREHMTGDSFLLQEVIAEIRRLRDGQDPDGKSLRVPHSVTTIWRGLTALSTADAADLFGVRADALARMPLVVVKGGAYRTDGITSWAASLAAVEVVLESATHTEYGGSSLPRPGTWVVVFAADVASQRELLIGDPKTLAAAAGVPEYAVEEEVIAMGRVELIMTAGTSVRRGESWKDVMRRLQCALL